MIKANQLISWLWWSKPIS